MRAFQWRKDFLLILMAIVWMDSHSTRAFAPLRRSSSAPSTTVLHDNLLDRFTNPIIDDKLLPLTEAGIAQVVAPSLQVFWAAASEAPYPSWAAPLYDPTFAPRGAFLAPTLVHGAGLACCWLAGCLAARAWEKSAYEGTMGQVLASTVRAGAFASGLLILATQFDIYRDMGFHFVALGESPETDAIILQHTKELFNDIAFEALVFLVWRVFRRKRLDEDYFGRKLK